jgi:hypothetical protein
MVRLFDWKDILIFLKLKSALGTPRQVCSSSHNCIAQSYLDVKSFLSQAEPTKQIRHIIELSLIFTSEISLKKKEKKEKMKLFFGDFQ